MSKPRFDARAIANHVLQVARELGLSLTPMQLMKIVYFAHGWSLGLRNRPLFTQPVQAWQYGPVIPDVYWAFSRFGRSPVAEPAKNEFGLAYEAELDEVDERIIRAVVAQYGKLHAFVLSDMTHQPGTPWQKSFKPGFRAVIGSDDIGQYFKGLASSTR